MDALEKGRLSVHPISDTRVEVRIAGELPIVWPERFAAALAPQAIAVRRGEVERRGEQWTGNFELEATKPGHNLASFDFAHIFDSLPATRQARPIAVLHQGLVRLTDALRLAIQAQDRHGFLADVLFTLKQLGLYPRRITIDSEADLVTQCFWLTSFGGGEIDVQTERLLRDFLGTCRKLRRT